MGPKLSRVFVLGYLFLNIVLPSWTTIERYLNRKYEVVKRLKQKH